MRHRIRWSVILSIPGVAGFLLACLLSGCEKSQSNTDTVEESVQDRAAIAANPALKVNAEDLKHTIVTPHLEEQIEPQTNVLWCNTFQLAWNEFSDLAGGPLGMNNPPAMVPALNKKAASKADIDDESYVAMAGFVEDGIHDKIRGALQQKFKTIPNPTLLNDVPQLANGAVAYAYLLKALPFRWAFFRYRGRAWPRGSSGPAVDWFGIAPGLGHNDGRLVQGKEWSKIANQVTVLSYRNDDDFVLELETRSEADRLILAKVEPAPTLGETIKVVEDRIRQAIPSKLQPNESMDVPVMDFDIYREYRELYGQPVRATNKKLDGLPIIFAAQKVRFRLDETGAVLASAAVFAEAPDPRQFVFDRPFLILLKRTDAKMPYFALWMGNAELLVSSQNR